MFRNPFILTNQRKVDFRNQQNLSKKSKTPEKIIHSLIAIGPLRRTDPKTKNHCIKFVTEKIFDNKKKQNIKNDDINSNLFYFALHRLEEDQIQQILSYGPVHYFADDLIFSRADDRNYSYIADNFEQFVDFNHELIFLEHVLLHNGLHSFVLDLSKPKLEILSQIVLHEVGMLLDYDNNNVLQFLLFNFSIFCKQNRYVIRSIILDNNNITTLDSFDQLNRYFPGIEKLSIKGINLKSNQDIKFLEINQHIKVSLSDDVPEYVTEQIEQIEAVRHPLRPISISDPFICEFIHRAQKSIVDLTYLYSSDAVFSVTTDIAVNDDDPLMYYQTFASDLMSSRASDRFWRTPHDIINIQNAIFSAGVIDPSCNNIQWNNIIPLSFSKQEVTDSLFCIVLSGAFYDLRKALIGFVKSFIIEQHIDRVVILNDQMHFYNIK